MLNDIQHTRRMGERFLLSKQESDGAWRGEVDLNPGPTAQVILLHSYIGRPFPEALRDKALRYILRMQNDDGGWSTYFGVPSDVSVTCECYVALRLLGLQAEDTPCLRAADRIRALGGLRQANPWTQLYCAVVGILPWAKIHKTPVEIMLIPEWLPIHISHLSYWVKAITIPMALLAAVGPGQPIALAPALQKELGVDPETFSANINSKFAELFLPAANAFFNVIPGGKATAIRRALAAIDQFTEDHGDFGGNTCTAMVVLLTKKCMGTESDPSFERGYQCLMGYAFETQDEWRIQCCQSHIWDTAFALNALPANESNSRDAVAKGIQWLKSQQITDVKGPWCVNVSAEPGGWCFGDRHKRFPVTDCTAVSLLALVKHDRSFISSEKGKRAIDWLIAMQHAHGGWSAYEKYRHGLYLNKLIKFKDIEGALVDIPKADVSSKVIEALGVSDARAPLEKAREFILSARAPNGLWTGNYGVNYIYGTAFAARALREIDRKPKGEWADPIRRFVLESQNRDGGWGESEGSYADRSLIGKGPSSVVQTAWAIMASVACFEAGQTGAKELAESIERGVRYLIDHQQPDGSWSEDRFLGTVFPGAVYFRYTYYPFYFPLTALEASESVIRASIRS